MMDTVHDTLWNASTDSGGAGILDATFNCGQSKAKTIFNEDRLV